MWYKCTIDSSGFDLALWKYDTTGVPANGFPKFIPNWFTNLDQISLGLAISGSSIWIASDKLNAGVRDLALIKYDLEGNLLFTKYWHTATRTNVRVRDIAVGQNGSLWVTGDTIGSNDYSRSAIWRFDDSGNLTLGFPQTLRW